MIIETKILHATLTLDQSYSIKAIMSNKKLEFIHIYNSEILILIIVLFAIKLLLFLFGINTFISIYNKKMVSFLKESFILLGFYLLLLGIYLSVIKIYFLDAISILALAPDSSILFDSTPSKIFLSLKNLHFFTNYQNPLFILDFSNDSQLSDFSH